MRIAKSGADSGDGRRARREGGGRGMRKKVIGYTLEVIGEEERRTMNRRERRGNANDEPKKPKRERRVIPSVSFTLLCSKFDVPSSPRLRRMDRCSHFFLPSSFAPRPVGEITADRGRFDSGAPPAPSPLWGMSLRSCPKRLQAFAVFALPGNHGGPRPVRPTIFLFRSMFNVRSSMFRQRRFWS